MREPVAAELRRLVISRAGNRCEYCLIREQDTFFGCEVDHVVSVKHGGMTAADNLAYACQLCNRQKGSDLGSLTVDGDLVRFFNPRTDRWDDHFTLVGFAVSPQTPIGEVTVKIFGFNHVERMLERSVLMLARRHP